MRLAIASTAALLALAHDARAFFRVLCGQLVLDRADPIINPGAVSSHLHTIMGGNGYAVRGLDIFDFEMTYDDARASSCSTCQPKADASNYWTPNLWYRAKNGTFHAVNQRQFTVYYLQRPNVTAGVRAFPAGFRMIAGDPTKRSFSGSIEQKQITHMCIGQNDDDRESYPLPDHECQNGLRTQVFFPSCWTGKDVDTPDHKSHVAYPSLGYDGDCPETHPVRLISIFYEIMWDTVYDDQHPNKNDFPKEWWVPERATQPFVLSNGDPTGYGFHGDFINGWDVDKLQAAADHCLAPSGVIQDCPLLELRTDYEKTECLQVPRVADETVDWVDHLPGCNPITSGPADAQMIPPSACGATTEIISKDSQQIKFPFISPVEGWTILGCAPDDINARVMSSERYANGAMTPSVCAAYCQERGFEYAGVEYGLECYCDHTFDQSLLTARTCSMHCDGDATVNCGGNARLAVYERGVSPAHASDTSTSQAITTSSPTPSLEPAHGPPVLDTRNQDAKQPSVLRPGWEKVGCYIDTVESRILPIRSFTDDAMTPEMCMLHCEEESYLYAGTEWAKECWCADELPDDAQKADDTECDMTYAGDAGSTCGGNLRIMIYWDADLDSENDDEQCVDALDADGTDHDGQTDEKQCESVEGDCSISMQPPSMRSLRDYLRVEQGNSSEETSF